MKRILMLAAMLLMAGMVNAKVVEKTFTVRGHCGMCKNRIETVAMGTEGVQEVYEALEPCCHYREIEGVNDHDHGHGEGHHHAE